MGLSNICLIPASSGETESSNSSSSEEDSLLRTTTTSVSNRPKTASTSKSNDVKESNTKAATHVEVQRDSENVREKQIQNDGNKIEKSSEDTLQDGEANKNINAKERAGTYDTMLCVDRDDAKKSIIDSFSSVEDDDRFPSQGIVNRLLF